MMKKLVCVVFMSLLFISFNTHAESAQNLKALKADQAPKIDGSGNDTAWRNAQAVIVRDRVADVDVKIKAVHVKDMVYFLVVYKDKEENRLHKPWVWDKDTEVYMIGSQREDGFTFKWNMMSKKVDLSNFSDNDYTADVWYWKAARTDKAGYSDDKHHILSSSPGKKHKELSSKGGKKRYLMRIGDKGQSAQKKRILTSYQGDIKDQYVSRKPDGSRADVRAKGIWKGGFWTIEFGRKLNTGHDDDVQFNITSGKKYQFGISVFGLYGEKIDKSKRHWYGQGRISENIYLMFR